MMLSCPARLLLPLLLHHYPPSPFSSLFSYFSLSPPLPPPLSVSPSARFLRFSPPHHHPSHKLSTRSLLHPPIPTIFSTPTISSLTLLDLFFRYPHTRCPFIIQSASRGTVTGTLIVLAVLPTILIPVLANPRSTHPWSALSTDQSSFAGKRQKGKGKGKRKEKTPQHRINKK